MPRSLLRLFGLGPAARPAAPSAGSRRRSRPRRARDFQRARVYRWEARHVFPLAGERLSLEGCRALVASAYAWREGRCTPPQVTDGRGRRHACGSREVIKLPRWARTRAIVLHECAHGMADDGHGPKFVAVYLKLLEEFARLDRRSLVLTLKAAGVSFMHGSN